MSVTLGAADRPCPQTLTLGLGVGTVISQDSVTAQSYPVGGEVHGYP